MQREPFLGSVFSIVLLVAGIIVVMGGLSVFFYINEKREPDAVVQSEKVTAEGRELVFKLSETKEYTNELETYLFEPISQSATPPITGEIHIDITLSNSKGEEADKGLSDGLAIDNGFEFKSDDYRRLYLFYFAPNNDWALAFEYGDVVEYHHLYKQQEADLTVRFEIVLFEGGRSVAVVTPSGEVREITLPSSLYDTSNNMVFAANVSPQSTLIIEELEIFNQK